MPSMKFSSVFFFARQEYCVQPRNFYDKSHLNDDWKRYVMIPIVHVSLCACAPNKGILYLYIQIILVLCDCDEWQAGYYLISLVPTQISMEFYCKFQTFRYTTQSDSFIRSHTEFNRRIQGLNRTKLSRPLWQHANWLTHVIENWTKKSNQRHILCAAKRWIRWKNQAMWQRYVAEVQWFGRVWCTKRGSWWNILSWCVRKKSRKKI